jgi:hypothetical protein
VSARVPSNRQLLLPALLPYLAYTGVATLAQDVPSELDYALRLLACGAALAWAWPRLGPLSGPRPRSGSLLIGGAAGLLGTALWIGLILPFAAPPGPAWQPLPFALRLLAASTVVPLIEERLMRGYLLGLVVQWQQARREARDNPLHRALHEYSVRELEPGAWSTLAVAVSTLLFAAGHQPGEWPAAFAYGLLMAALWIVRRDLLSCVVAHAVTNATLAGIVLVQGRWELW